MTEPYVGQVQLFAFNFAPRGWALCQGQILPIQQYTALFSLLGTNYGGNGQTTFGLPNLQGTAVVGVGQGPGLTDYEPGQTGGSTSVTLAYNELAPHSHNFMAASAAGTTITAAGNQLGISQLGSSKQGPSTTAKVYSPNPGSATTGLAPPSISQVGGNQPHNNMQPYLVLNYCIALSGIFPARN
ncbi:phage tail protein [Labrys okinawensis]|uniref:phage tail protein n=1 Tax=Labrys okinawensis TaxID=346911 RepID=UPI0039BC5B2A